MNIFLLTAKIRKGLFKALHIGIKLDNNYVYQYFPGPKSQISSIGPGNIDKNYIVKFFT